MRHVARMFGLAMLSALLVLDGGSLLTAAQSPVASPEASPDLLLTGAAVTHNSDLGVLIFEQQVDGTAGATVPDPVGQLDGAPVLGHVFPTTLSPTAVGFSEVDGILALAVTSHPDFDDTPLWDENVDGIYDNDGVVYHTHWVVVGPDERVSGGLAVLEFHSNGAAVTLPPTAPGMPMYMDSPGFAVQLNGDTLKVLVPVDRVGNQTEFNYDAVTAYLEVNTSDPDRPMLGVYAVYSVLSGDLSLPYAVVQS
ncbi:MAG: hypothetical protein M9947_08020 [Thermomicrobiales bacterium]|nr:hypothetical protein [Thermomicrobiales bacterium]